MPVATRGASGSQEECWNSGRALTGRPRERKESTAIICGGFLPLLPNCSCTATKQKVEKWKWKKKRGCSSIETKGCIKEE